MGDSTEEMEDYVMQKLRELVDWLYEHVDPADRGKIEWRTERVVLEWPGDPDVEVANYTALVFSKGGTEVWKNADALLRFPQNIHWILVDVGKDLDVGVTFEYWLEPEKPTPWQPVGGRWEAQGPNAYFVVDPKVNPGDTFTDERGLFLAVRRVNPFLGIPYQVWIKQEVEE